MATISFRSGKWRVVVRKKNQLASATFSDKETAELWARYKEDLIDEISNFEFKFEKTIKLDEAIDFKLKELRENGADKKTIYDVVGLRDNFSKFLDIPISEIKPEELVLFSQEMLKTTVRRGGRGDNTGKAVIQSPTTVFRKLVILSGVFSMMIKKGADIKNPVLLAVNQVRGIKDEK